jgi:hypothetical protein
LNCQSSTLARLLACAAIASFTTFLPESGRAEWDSTDTLSINQAGITLQLGASNGPTVLVDGVPFSSFGRVYSVKPGWSERYYGYEDDPGFVERARRSLNTDPQPPGGARITVPLRSKRTEFEGTQTFKLCPDRRLRVSLDARLTTTVPNTLEYKPASIFPGWLTGRHYSFEAANGKSGRGAIPIEGKIGSANNNTLVKDFLRLNLDTRMGPVEIVAAGLPMTLIDFRKNLWNDPKWMFWVGVHEGKLKPGKTLQSRVEFRFPPAPADTPTAIGETTSAAAAARVHPVRKVVSEYRHVDRVIPTPKQITWAKTNLPLPDGSRISVEGGGEAAPFADETVEQVKTLCNVGLSSAPGPEKSAITVRLRRDFPAPKIAAELARESYRISVSQSGALLEAGTTEGLANAVKTFRQLIRTENGEASVRGVEISDWPSLPFRAIHFFSGKNARDLQTRMVCDVLGALKINRLVWQCEYIKWDGHPEIHSAKYGMDKADAAAVRDEAHRQHIEIIPLINTYGHCEWLLENTPYRDLADDPARPYAYDATNPAVYPLCESIYEEAIDFFRPGIVHIGHDEINPPDFPKREAGRREGATAMILRDIEHYRKFLAARGARTMIWGDLFLAGGESPDACNAPSVEDAVARRNGLAKDIIIADWHYAPAKPRNYTSLGVLRAAGFDVVACPWSAPANIMCFSKAAADEMRRPTPRPAEGAAPADAGKSLGTMQTTWAGYSFDSHSLWEAPDQYAAYVLAAEAAWNGGGASAADVPFRHVPEFNRIWHDDLLPRSGADGWTLDLDAAAGFNLSANAGEQWMGFANIDGMKGFPARLAKLGRFLFELPGKPGAPRALLMSGRFNPPGNWPERVCIPVDDTATTLVFAVAATFQAPVNPPIATCGVQFDDGTSEIIRWEAGETVFALESDAENRFAPLLWSAKGKLPTYVHAYVWHNPRPGNRIRRLVFESSNQGSALMLFGVSGIQ